MKRSLLLAMTSLALAQSPQPQTVKEDQSPLRAGCPDDSEILARLKKGDAVRIRFALAGSARPCYCVTAEVDGKKLQGYVWAEALTGLEQFEQARRLASASVAARSVTRDQVAAIRESAAAQSQTSAPGETSFALAAEIFRAADALQSGRAADAEQILAKAAPPPSHREAAYVRAAALLELNQPDRALEILEPALKANPRDVQLLSLAGMASYKADHPRDALAYWKAAVEVRPDGHVDEMIHKVENEIASDKSSQQTFGTRFLLRYDGAVADADLARSMVAVLEEEFSRISFQLGCRAEERIVTIIQSPAAYRKTTEAAEWAGGLYDGKIRIPLAAGKRIDPETRRVFAHEIVHACMANIGRWPAWLHEGMAQKLSGERTDPRVTEMLKAVARASKLPKLDATAGNWSGLNTMQAAVRYALALAAMDLFFQKYSPRNLMNNPESLPQITAELDRALPAALGRP